MLRIIGTLLIIILSTVLQSSVITMIPYINTTPNLLLVVAFAVGVLRGRSEGMIYGLICGITLDLLSGGLVGFYGLLYMYIGYLSGFLYQLFEVESPMVAIILTVISEVIYHTYVFVFRFVIRGRLSIGAYMESIILPELIFTVAAGILLYGALVEGNKALEKYEQRRALKFV